MIARAIGNEAIAAIAARHKFVFIIAGVELKDGGCEHNPRAWAVNKPFSYDHGIPGASMGGGEILSNSPPSFQKAATSRESIMVTMPDQAYGLSIVVVP